MLNTMHITNTRTFWMTIISARTRIHRSHQHKASRIGDARSSANKTDETRLEWLTQNFQDITIELSKLIHKQNAIVCERNFSKFRYPSTAADKPCIRSRMMRSTKRAFVRKNRIVKKSMQT